MHGAAGFEFRRTMRSAAVALAMPRLCCTGGRARNSLMIPGAPPNLHWVFCGGLSERVPSLQTVASGLHLTGGTTAGLGIPFRDIDRPRAGLGAKDLRVVQRLRQRLRKKHKTRLSVSAPR
jgi:hypothetical protein